MEKKLSNWDTRIGRRVRMRDLHVLLSVVQYGSMAKAAASLSVSQPAISDAIATLEAPLGVRLLDRSRRGVQPTVYGATLLKYGRLAIEDLRQGVREIEFLADPTAGELRIGCPESIATGPLVPIIERLAERFPRVRLHVEQFSTTMIEFPALEKRDVDLVIARLNPMPLGNRVGSVDGELLFEDRFLHRCRDQQSIGAAADHIACRPRARVLDHDADRLSWRRGASQGISGRESVTTRILHINIFGFSSQQAHIERPARHRPPGFNTPVKCRYSLRIGGLAKRSPSPTAWKRRAFASTLEVGCR